jgi:hypothetical protein
MLMVTAREWFFGLGIPVFLYGLGLSMNVFQSEYLLDRGSVRCYFDSHPRVGLVESFARLFFVKEDFRYDCTVLFDGIVGLPCC